MANSVQITGIEEVDRRLKHLEKKEARRIGRKALTKGMAVVVKELRKQTPIGPDVTMTSKSGQRYTRKGGTLRKSVGKRHKKNKRKGILESKVGYNVGLKHRKAKEGATRQPRRRAPHAHLYSMGTAARRQKTTGRSVGRAPRHSTVKKVYGKTAGRCRDLMMQVIDEGIQKAADYS